MDVAKVIQQHKRLCAFVSERRIKQSLDILSDMIAILIHQVIFVMSMIIL